jgi:ankyrin repeat protein
MLYVRVTFKKVKRLVAEGAHAADSTNLNGNTALLWAASYGHIPIMHWLLTEGGSSLDEKDKYGENTVLMTALMGHYPALQYLLEGQGALLSESDSHMYGRTVWDAIIDSGCLDPNDLELSSLLKVMVMLEDAPASSIIGLSPQHDEICSRGRQLRAQLPSYLEQQRTAVVAHCPLPAVLDPGQSGGRGPSD